MKCYKLNTSSTEASKAVDELNVLGFDGFLLMEDFQCVVVWEDKQFTTTRFHETEDCDLSKETKFYTNKEEFLEVIKKEVANKWKDQIDPRAYEALINYQVEITD